MSRNKPKNAFNVTLNSAFLDCKPVYQPLICPVQLEITWNSGGRCKERRKEERIFLPFFLRDFQNIAAEGEKKGSLAIKVIMHEVPKWGHIKYTLCIWVMFELT